MLQAVSDEQYSEFIKCAESPSYFIMNYCKTMDVETSEVKVFPDYPYLREFFDQNTEPCNEHVEKSRQMTVSWAFMALFLWDIQFKSSIADFVTSRKEALIDDGGSNSTPDSLLGKVRFMWEGLPPFLKMPLDFAFLKVRNPVTASFIKGESANPDSGRGGTYYRALMDEAALVPRSETVFGALCQACKKGLYMNSTPCGRGGAFARIRFDKETTFRKRSLHWKIHPLRDDKWYQDQVINMTPDEVARELDISYEKSVAGQIYHMFDYNTQVGDYPYDPDFPLYRGWDFGTGNPTAILWIQERPVPGQRYPEIRIFDELEQSERTPDYFGNIVNAKPYRSDAKDFGDPAGKQRQANMKSWVSWLGECGIRIDVKYGVRIVDSILAGQRIMPHVRVDRKCVRFLECLSDYKHPTDNQGKVIGDGYEDNWATHIMKAFEYYAVNRHPLRSAEWKVL